jgi:hypothetical protein
MRHLKGLAPSRSLEVAVSLGNEQKVDVFHHATLQALQLVASCRRDKKAEEIDKLRDSHLTLANANGFNEDKGVAGSLAQANRLSRAACHTAERAARWRRAHVRALVIGKVQHARFVSEQGATTLCRRWVNSKDSESRLWKSLQQPQAKGLNPTHELKKKGDG